MNNDNKGLWLIGVVAVLAVGGLAVYYNYPAFHPASTAASPAEVAPANSPASPTAAAPAVPLETSDPVFRDRAKALATGSKLDAWLQTDNLIRRLTAATAIIANGSSPRDSLGFLAPGKPFRAKRKNGSLVIDPRSYARYDTLADTIASIDPVQAGKTFNELMPLFQTAYGELENPKADFKTAWIQAVNELLQTPRVSGDIRLKRKIVTYAMADAELEKLSAAQKHLLRMGPANVAKIQDKLIAISSAIGVSADQLAKPREYAPK